MSVKELNEIARKDIPYHVRLKNAIKIRDFKNSAKVLNKKFSLEIFNNINVFKEGDLVGITIYHPNIENPTHFKTLIYPTDIGEKEFGKQVKIEEKNLIDKIKGK